MENTIALAASAKPVGRILETDDLGRKIYPLLGQMDKSARSATAIRLGRWLIPGDATETPAVDQ